MAELAGSLDVAIIPAWLAVSFFISFFISFLWMTVVLPFWLPALMPRWPFLLAVVVLVGFPLGYALYMESISVSTKPDDDWAGWDLGLLSFATFWFALGVLSRACLLVLNRFRLRWRTEFVVLFAVFLTPIALFFASRVPIAWDHRPAKEVCYRIKHELKIANGRIFIPLRSPVAVQLVGEDRGDSFGFWLNKHARAFCGLTNEGARAVSAGKVTLSFNEVFAGACRGTGPRTKGILCKTVAEIDFQKFENSDLPDEVYIFSPDDIDWRAFRGSKSTFADSKNHIDHQTLRSPQVFYELNDHVRTPDANPVTAACKDWGPHQLVHCHVAYSWRDGMHVMYKFRAKKENAAERATLIYGRLQELLASFELRSGGPARVR